jgi:hypothetical protein
VKRNCFSSNDGEASEAGYGVSREGKESSKINIVDNKYPLRRQICGEKEKFSNEIVSIFAFSLLGEEEIALLVSDFRIKYSANFNKSAA